MNDKLHIGIWLLIHADKQLWRYLVSFDIKYNMYSKNAIIIRSRLSIQYSIIDCNFTPYSKFFRCLRKTDTDKILKFVRWIFF